MQRVVWRRWFTLSLRAVWDHSDIMDEEMVNAHGRREVTRESSVDTLTKGHMREGGEE